MTLGTPIGMFVKNKDMRPHDYGDMSQVPAFPRSLRSARRCPQSAVPRRPPR